MAFQGSLSDLPLPDIIQVVATSGKTGVFKLERGREVGEIYLDDGQIVDAELGELRGEEAVYEIAVWQDGEFVFEPGATSSEVTIHRSYTNLLMEAARRIDEWKVLSKKIPSSQMIPRFSDREAASSVSLNPQEWALIREIDERRSLDEIAAALQTSPFDAAKILYGLITSGLVELEKETPPQSGPQLADLPEERLRELLAAVQLRARRDLESGRFEDLRRFYTQAQDAIGDGQGEEGVKRYIEAARQTIAAEHGPEAAQRFLTEVEGLVPVE